jgi:hypothetical protein
VPAVGMGVGNAEQSCIQREHRDRRLPSGDQAYGLGVPPLRCSLTEGRCVSRADAAS